MANQCFTQGETRSIVGEDVNNDKVSEVPARKSQVETSSTSSW